MPRSRTAVSKRQIVTFLLGAVLLFPSGCSPAPTPAPHTVRVSPASARTALNDLVLMLQDGFLRRVTTAGDAANERTVTSPDDRLLFAWSEDANFATGEGRFHLVLDAYTIRTDSPFAAEYSGYVASGELVLDTRLSQTWFTLVDITLAHAEPHRFPVRHIRSEVHSGPYGMVPAQVYVRVNDQIFLADLVYPPTR